MVMKMETVREKGLCPLLEKGECAHKICTERQYSFLNNTICKEAWLWEFERRTPLYEAVHKCSFDEPHPQEDDLLFNIGGPFATPDTPWCDLPADIQATRRKGVSRDRPVRTVNLRWKGNSQSGDKEESEESDDRTTWTLEKILKAKPICNDGEHERPRVSFHQGTIRIKYKGRDCNTPFEVLRRELGRENVLMSMIDVTAPDEEIIKALKSELTNWRKKIGANTKKAPQGKNKGNYLVGAASIWKSYLIIYDLHKSGKSSKALSDELAKCAPEYAEQRTIERHLRESKRLIEEYGYRELF